MTGDLERALQIFSSAAAYIERAGLLAEVEWQRQTAFQHFTERDLLREAAWVVLCTGFRESVVRKIFSHVSLCFCDWESANAIVANAAACRMAAMASIRNVRKLGAIVEIARRVDAAGFSVVKRRVLDDPITELQRLPYVGPVTAWHLAKNLGLDVAKPDRHLVCVSNLLGYKSVGELCSAIASATGETVKVVDLILWRYFADIRLMKSHSPAGRRLSFS